MKIDCKNLDHKKLNETIAASEDKNIVLSGCLGQRYIGCGLSDKTIEINGTPGNALGAYMNGATVRVFGNGQDAIGDTMNEGTIYVHGSCGDATGYAMRGGRIFVKGDIGYRAGIHMKAYQDKIPAVIVGGNAGSFLGEYQAGGHIVVLGLGVEEQPRVGFFCGPGIQGGQIFLRMNEAPKNLPVQVSSCEATEEDLEEIKDYIKEFCSEFKTDYDKIMSHKFIVLTPNNKNPYKQLYTNH
ncbi:MAG: glutamate synthase [Bacillota bacterium]|nr:glutamate synthase [Bacillota bacterium]